MMRLKFQYAVFIQSGSAELTETRCQETLGNAAAQVQFVRAQKAEQKAEDIQHSLNLNAQPQI